VSSLVTNGEDSRTLADCVGAPGYRGEDDASRDVERGADAPRKGSSSTYLVMRAIYPCLITLTSANDVSFGVVGCLLW
jgi:hypothetical protein